MPSVASSRLGRPTFSTRSIRAATCSFVAAPCPVMLCLMRVGAYSNTARSRLSAAGHRHALCPAEFEHALDILPEKGGFECHFAGTVLVDEGSDPVEDVAQLDVRVRVAMQVDGPQHDRGELASVDLQNTVSHVGSCPGRFP